jgi:Sensors of blue-light using FAD
MIATSVFELIYVSRANPALMSRGVRQNLRIQAQIKNARHGITGLLLYSNGLIMQVLQGDESVVRACYGLIAEDNRHREVEVMRAQMIPARTFAEWSMALIDIEAPVSTSEIKMLEVLAESRREDHRVPDGATLIRTFIGADWRRYLVA